MLKISEMASLANTTRRTLIFYDEEKVFTPNFRNKSGYRLYDYDQLYDLLFILGLRNLDVPLADIKNIQNSTSTPKELLINTQNKIDNKIAELEKIQKILNKKIADKVENDNTELYVPVIKNLSKRLFWNSIKSSGCTADEVAQLFSDFYKHLDNLAIMETGKTGFFTDLSVNNPNKYPDAAFQVIKEITESRSKTNLPVIEKSAGYYVCVLVTNNSVGINKGLTILKDYCIKNNLNAEDYLWQINTNNNFIETGASKYGWLEYKIVDK